MDDFSKLVHTIKSARRILSTRDRDRQCVTQELRELGNFDMYKLQIQNNLDSQSAKYFLM